MFPLQSELFKPFRKFRVLASFTLHKFQPSTSRSNSFHSELRIISMMDYAFRTPNNWALAFLQNRWSVSLMTLVVWVKIQHPPRHPPSKDCWLTPWRLHTASFCLSTSEIHTQCGGLIAPFEFEWWLYKHMETLMLTCGGYIVYAFRFHWVSSLGSLQIVDLPLQHVFGGKKSLLKKGYKTQPGALWTITIQCFPEDRQRRYAFLLKYLTHKNFLRRVLKTNVISNCKGTANIVPSFNWRSHAISSAQILSMLSLPVLPRLSNFHIATFTFSRVHCVSSEMLWHF